MSKVPLSVATATMIEVPIRTDERGALSFAEVGRELPFVPQRYFTIQAVQRGEVRGNHAHRTLHQFIVCLHGSCTLQLDDGRARDQLVLDSPAVGVHVHPGTWCTLTGFSSDGVVLVLASARYDADDYIHDYAEFVTLRGQS